MGKFAGCKGISSVNLRGARGHLHECVNHNQDKNERDLLRSMFGVSLRNRLELLIGKTHVGVTYASARSTVNLGAALGGSKHKQLPRL